MARKTKTRPVVSPEDMVSPQPGPQSLALDTRRFCKELLFGGARGGGKTVFLLMDYAVDVKEYGDKWHGILFRRTYPRLDEVVKLSNEMMPKVDPRAEFRVGSMTWHFSNGATLKFRHLDTDQDSQNYQGHSYSWLGWDELGEWPTEYAYNRLKATLRPSGGFGARKKADSDGVFRRIRATANPGGVGHAWLKARFIDPAPQGYEMIMADTATEMDRMFIPSRVTDNKIMLSDDPGYLDTLKAATHGNEQLYKAWVDGDWDVFFGRFFTMFDPAVHRADPIDVLEAGMIPETWSVEGSLDYGEAKPTSFGLWATSPDGVSYRLAEHYEDGLWVDEHAGRIAELCRNCPYVRGRMPRRIWADPMIFHTRAAAGYGSMRRMVSDIFRVHGLRVIQGNRDRLSGWRYMKSKLAWRRDPNTGKMVEWPSLYYFPECVDFERQMVNAVYAGSEDDPKEDLDTKGEDHSLDDARYFIMGRMLGQTKRKPDFYVGTTFEREMARKRQARVFGYTSPRGLVIHG